MNIPTRDTGATTNKPVHMHSILTSTHLFTTHTHTSPPWPAQTKKHQVPYIAQVHEAEPLCALHGEAPGEPNTHTHSKTTVSKTPNMSITRRELNVALCDAHHGVPHPAAGVVMVQASPQGVRFAGGQRAATTERPHTQTTHAQTAHTAHQKGYRAADTTLWRYAKPPHTTTPPHDTPHTIHPTPKCSLPCSACKQESPGRELLGHALPVGFARKSFCLHKKRTVKSDGRAGETSGGEPNNWSTPSTEHH